MRTERNNSLSVAGDFCRVYPYQPTPPQGEAERADQVAYDAARKAKRDAQRNWMRKTFGATALRSVADAPRCPPHCRGRGRVMFKYQQEANAKKVRAHDRDTKRRAKDEKRQAKQRKADAPNRERARQRAERHQDVAAHEMVKAPLDWREINTMAEIAEHLKPDSRKVLREACYRVAATEAAKWQEMAARFASDDTTANKQLGHSPKDA